MREISGKQDVRCKGRAKNSLMHLFRLFTVRSGNYQPMRRLCFLLKDRKSIYQLDMPFFRMNNPRGINNVWTPNSKRLNHQRFLRLQVMRMKQLGVDSVVDNPNFIFRKTVFKQIILDIITGADDTFDSSER